VKGLSQTQKGVFRLDPMHAEIRSELYFWLGGINFFNIK
jgi:hypothetical protein